MGNSKLFLFVCVLSLLTEGATRRGGGGLGGRVSSGGRISTGGRGSSAARTSSSGGYHQGGVRGGQNQGGSRTGPYQQGGGSHGTMGGTSWNNRGGSGGAYSSSSYGRSQPRQSTFSKSGIGSALRSSQFKSAIAGAAAGILTYKAGKAIIRSMSAPMMWNNRPYYWGSSYYPPSRWSSNMCRMPIDPSDSTFGNIYSESGSRPKEIVWSCDYYEHCCGFECCRGGGAGTFSGWGIGLGSIFVLLLVLGCCFYICFKLFRSSLDCLLPSHTAKYGNEPSNAQYYPGFRQ